MRTIAIVALLLFGSIGSACASECLSQSEVRAEHPGAHAHYRIRDGERCWYVHGTSSSRHHQHTKVASEPPAKPDPASPFAPEQIAYPDFSAGAIHIPKTVWSMTMSVPPDVPRGAGARRLPVPRATTAQAVRMESGFDWLPALFGGAAALLFAGVRRANRKPKGIAPRLIEPPAWVRREHREIRAMMAAWEA